MQNSCGMSAKSRRVVLLALFLLVGTASAGRAQDEATEAEEPSNAASVMVGVTAEPADRGSGASFTLGVDYERRLTKFLGVGAFAEGAFGNTEREALLGVPLFVHAYAGLILTVAPLVEISQPRNEDAETEMGLRMGAAWEFPVGDRYAVLPKFSLDFIQSDVILVFGLSGALQF